MAFSIKRRLQLVGVLSNYIIYAINFEHRQKSSNIAYMSELKTRTILFEALTLCEDGCEGGEEPQR